LTLSDNRYKLVSDYTVEQHFKATIKDLIRDLSGGIAEVAVENITEGKEMINKMFGFK